MVDSYSSLGLPEGFRPLIRLYLLQILLKLGGHCHVLDEQRVVDPDLFHDLGIGLPPPKVPYRPDLLIIKLHSKLKDLERKTPKPPGDLAQLMDDIVGEAEAMKKAERRIDTLLNLVSGRLGLDHDRVLAGRYAFPVMSRYLDQQDGRFAGGAVEQDRLLFWYLESAMWGRFSSSVESVLDKDMEALQQGGLDGLIRELRLWRGGLRVQPDHFGGWSLGARFYPVLYLLTRIGEAKDWGLERPSEMRFTLGDRWNLKLFLALCRRYGLQPYRTHGQRRTTVMLKVVPRFANEILWPEFTKLAEALMTYLDEATERIIREEVFKDTEEPVEG